MQKLPQVLLGRRDAAQERSRNRPIHTSGANLWADLVACSGTSPGGLTRLMQPEAESENTVITSPNKIEEKLSGPVLSIVVRRRGEDLQC